MTVVIEVKQVRSVVEGPLYRVDTSVLRAQQIDPEIFVLSTEDDSFNHVATVWDMQTYPNTKQEAQATGSPFYRVTQAVVDYENENTAVSAASYTLARVDALAREYQVVNEGFLGTTEHTYTGGS